MKQSALRSVFFFQRMVIGLDNYKGKESLSRVVVILFVSVASGQSVEILFVFKSPFRSVYKELHADHKTGAADNK